MNTDAPRLNKFLASCGIGSRRACDEIIQQGRVEINGSICTNLSTKVQEQDHVKVDGKRLTQKENAVFIFHKPRHLVCTREDEKNRETIYSILPRNMHNLHHVGRLDMESEGLLILTNDGELTHTLLHPSNSIEKEYIVTSNQSFQNQHLDQFLEGVYADGVKLKARSIERMSPRRIRVILDHGIKRHIRVMLSTLGYQVTKLIRVRIGSLWLGDLEPGDYALLNQKEYQLLLKNPAAHHKAVSEKNLAHKKLNRRQPRAPKTPKPPAKKQAAPSMNYRKKEEEDFSAPPRRNNRSPRSNAKNSGAPSRRKY